MIVFEGIDGSGKTTQSRRLLDYLTEHNRPAAWYREPSDSPWGKKIRRLSRRSGSLTGEEELDLFIRDRRWNVRQQVKPALREGRTVILDRYYFSTAAYQGARGFDWREIIRKNRIFAPEPDLAIYIDIPVSVALERIEKNRGTRVPLFEEETFLQRVRDLYRVMEGETFVTIDGRPAPDEVFRVVISEIARRFPGFPDAQEK